MVKKIKSFIVFCLGTFVFSLISGKNAPLGNREEWQNKISWNSAEAKTRKVCVSPDIYGCYPPESWHDVGGCY